MNTILKLAAATAITLAGALVAQAAELRLSVETPPGHVRNMAAEKWAEAIAGRSGGSLTVQVFPAAQLYKSADAIRALASGALDLSIQANVTLSRFEPNLSITALPMFFGATRDDIRKLLDGPLGAELWGFLESKGIAVAEGGHFEFAPNHSAFTTDKAIGSYADMAGVKLATPPSPVIVTILKTVGAAPQATPRSEIVLQLTQGQIDGLGLVTDLTITGGKLWEAGIANVFADNAGWGFYIPLVSTAAMAKLSDEEQAIVHAAWGDVVEWARDQAASELAEARKTNEENGVTYVDPDPVEVAAMRERLIAAQDEIVVATGMDADYVARVAAALAGN